MHNFSLEAIRPTFLSEFTKNLCKGSDHPDTNKKYILEGIQGTLGSQKSLF